METLSLSKRPALDPPRTIDPPPQTPVGAQPAAPHVRTVDPLALFLPRTLDKIPNCAILIEVIFSQTRRPIGAFFISKSNSHHPQPKQSIRLIHSQNGTPATDHLSITCALFSKQGGVTPEKRNKSETPRPTIPGQLLRPESNRRRSRSELFATK